MVAEQAMLQYDCAFVDDGQPLGNEICGIPVIGRVDDLPELRREYSLLVVGIGNNRFRAQVYEKAKALGFAFPNIVAPSAYISLFAEVGCGCVLMQNACVQNGASVGNGVLLNAGTEVHCGGTVGDYVLLYTNSTIRTGAKVGRYARIGGNVTVCIATSKIAVTLDNRSKKWYNMSQGDEKNGQNAAQCGVESSC